MDETCLEATKQEYIVLCENLMYTSTTLKNMMKQTMNSKVVAILILYIANNKMMAKAVVSLLIN